MAERNRIAEIYALLLDAEEDLANEHLTAQGWRELCTELNSNILERVAEIVLEREEKSKWLQVTARTLFEERYERGVRWNKPDSYEPYDPAEDEAHMEWLRGEIKARDDELTVMQDTIYRQQETIAQLQRGNR